MAIGVAIARPMNATMIALKSLIVSNDEEIDCEICNEKPQRTKKMVLD
jgi:hypothetical protein